mmetsp:Transcript_33244/g.69620  ORF Transcript_33244/g.69620 Transcript_33244/m.69620 type:complete len:151 (+) Transcript_33244:289-741(+)
MSPALWLKVTARAWRGRDWLRGLDCVLRSEASLKVREKADPASCMAACAVRGSAASLRAREKEGAASRMAGRGERGSDCTGAAQQPSRCVGSRGSALLRRVAVLGAEVVLKIGTSFPGRIGKLQVLSAGSLGDCLRVSLLECWLGSEALD